MNRRRTIRVAAAFFVGCIVVLTGDPASASPGSVADPQGDAGGYKTDIKVVYHDDDPASRTVTYYVQTFSNFDNAGWVGGVEWDFNEDGAPDGSLQYTLEWGSSYQVYNRQSNDAVDDVDDANYLARSKVDAKHNPSGSTSSNTVKIVVPKPSMEKAGMGKGDNGYNYTAYLGERDNDQNTDYTTGGKPKTRHTFSTGTSATLTPATPKPSTPQPTVATKAPTQATPDPDDELAQERPAPAGVDLSSEAEATFTPTASPMSGAAFGDTTSETVDDTTRSGVSTGLIAGAALLALGIGGGTAFAFVRRARGRS